jgi:hypothetical protein
MPTFLGLILTVNVVIREIQEKYEYLGVNLTLLSSTGRRNDPAGYGLIS